jgi:Ca2+-transporting ATPase
MQVTPDSEAVAEDLPTNWHALSSDETVARLGGDAVHGLSDAEAQRRLQAYGPNEIPNAPNRSAWSILFHQFQSAVVLLLLAATAVAFALGDLVESAAILVVILLNAAIGFLTEWKAERALTALRRVALPSAHVVRGGGRRRIDAREIVRGDLIILEAGAHVSADGRVLECASLEIDEAILTGESKPVSKAAEPVADVTATLGDRRSMAYSGTTVAAGRGKMIVTDTGLSTEAGKIGALLQSAAAPRTPLEKKIDELGRRLIAAVAVISSVIVFVGWLRGHAFLPMLEVGISLAIAAVPEGLPVVATLTLAIGVQRMARKRTLVRRLHAVEALGAVTVICSDKTGTLTKNEMTAAEWVVGRRRILASGVGYEPIGEFKTDAGASIDPLLDSHFGLSLRIGALCNDSRIEWDADGVRIFGDPTEAALTTAAEKAGMTANGLHRAYPRLSEIPFDSRSKRMTTVHRTPDGDVVAYVKGSPGTLLDRSVSVQSDAGPVTAMTGELTKHFENANQEMAGRALRVLGLAWKRLPDGYAVEEVDRELVFVGLVGMIDPLRDEAKAAIETCRAAGIRTIMITGDQPATAAEIGRQLGLDRDAAGIPLAVVHGRELDGRDGGDLRRLARTASVFARVSPKHKLSLVEALQADGHVVAMTGDGFNDAPALKAADIGVAMGGKGAEAAKQAASIIVTDDDFATIVTAVEQGRIVFNNIVKFIHYLFSCNIAEIIVVFGALVLGMPMPLAAIQILWLNLLTDVLPAMALALEPSSQNVMKRPPRDPKRELVDLPFSLMIGWQDATLAATSLVAFWVALRWHAGDDGGIVRAQTIAFQTLAFAQIFHAFSARSQSRSIFSDGFLTNGWLWSAATVCAALQIVAVHYPPLQRVLHTDSLALSEWGLVLAASSSPVAVFELGKLVRRRPW